MNFQLAPTEDIGLQHVLENGLALIRGQSFESARRRQVLTNLIEIFTEAAEGSRALQPRNLIFAVEQRSAFVRFSVFYRYLSKRFGDEVPNRIRDTLEVLTAIRNGSGDNDLRRASAEALIKNLLDSLGTEKALTPLIAPATFQY